MPSRGPGARPVCAFGRGSAGQERLRDRSAGQELLHGRFPASCAAWPVGAVAAVVRVDDGSLARGDQRVLGDELAGHGLVDAHPPVAGQPNWTGAPIRRFGIEYRAEPNRTQDSLSTLRKLARSNRTTGAATAARRAGHVQVEALDRDRADLRVLHGVDLRAPHHGGGVRGRQVAERFLKDHQIRLGAADEMLHDLCR